MPLGCSRNHHVGGLLRVRYAAPTVRHGRSHVLDHRHAARASGAVADRQLRPRVISPRLAVVAGRAETLSDMPSLRALAVAGLLSGEADSRPDTAVAESVRTSPTSFKVLALPLGPTERSGGGSGCRCHEPVRRRRARLHGRRRRTPRCGGEGHLGPPHSPFELVYTASTPSSTSTLARPMPPSRRKHRPTAADAPAAVLGVAVFVLGGADQCCPWTTATVIVASTARDAVPAQPGRALVPRLL